MAKLNWPIQDATRRGIQVALGWLWLLDGVLQLQPQMFTSRFVADVIAPAAQGQPSFISGPIHLFSTLFLLQPALFNSFAAITQLALGVLILWKRTAWFGLVGSVAWGLFVWYVGEGLAGLANGHALLLMGAPGAALVYALLALAVLPTRNDKAKPADHRPAYWLLIAWIAIWTVGAVYELLPGQNTVDDVSAMVSANADSAPHWLASIDVGVANALTKFGHRTLSPADQMADRGMNMTPGEMAQMRPRTVSVSGLWLLLLVAFGQLVIAFAVILPGWIRLTAVALGSALSLFFWVIGQSLGSYYTGVATDPNTGPLLVLLGIAVLACTHRDVQIRQYFVGVKKAIVRELRAFNEGEVSAYSVPSERVGDLR